MRILIVNPYYFPNNIGGTEIVIHLLAEKLAEKGIGVAIYTLDSRYKWLFREENNGILIYRGCGGKYKIPIKEINKLERFNNAIVQRLNLKIERELQTVINEFRPNIVNTHNLYGFSTIVWRIVKNNGIPIVHTVNDAWLLKKSVFPFAKFNSSAVDFVIAPSEYILSQHIKKLFDTKYKVIVNGINMEQKYFEECLLEKIEREESRSVKFMFAGQLEKFKGIDKLLEEFHKCTEEKIELHIYGRGLLKDMAEDFALLDNRIFYHGFVTSEQMRQAYRNADVLVAPSVWQEAFGMVAIEAYYHSLPVIAGDRGGLREVVQAVGSGKLINPEKAGSINEALLYYMNRKNIKKEIVHIGQSINIYNIDYQVNSYIDIFQALMTG